MNKTVKTDIHELVSSEVDNRMKPALVMIGESEERIIKRFERLEDLVIRKRLFYRKLVVGVLLFLALILFSGC
jgi:hypothetical protein